MTRIVTSTGRALPLASLMGAALVLPACSHGSAAEAVSSQACTSLA